MKLLIGLSGGADSMALLHLLRMQGGRELIAVHVNHGIRGAASDGDEAFVRDVCQQWDVPLMVYRAEPSAHPGEDWARQARYGFFREAMQATDAEAIALAHHRDDQAETVLLHLLRGSGLTGLTGMPPESDVLGVRVVRPLLDMPRSALRQMLREAGIPWREDDSNADGRYLRNALRKDLLPLMEQLAPGASERIAATAELLRQDEAVLDALADRALGGHAGKPYLPIGVLEDQLPGMVGRILRRWWQSCVPSMEERSLNRQQTADFAALVNGAAGGKCNLPGGWHGYRGWTHLHLVGQGSIRTQVDLVMEETIAGTGDGRTCQTVPRAMLEGCEVRTRRKGDVIRPFGMAGRRSLQDYMVDKRVDAPFRDCVPLLCRDSEVLLVAGIGAGEIPPMDPTKDNVTLRWLGDMPWAQT